LDGDEVSHLALATSIAQLKNFVNEAEKNLDNSDKKYWQSLLERNSWTISQMYATPTVLFQREAYIGGKNIQNRGGNIVDFLFKNKVTNSVAIVEIKTPTTPLTSAATYRNNGYAPSRELTGAVQQILQDLYSLRDQHRSLAGDSIAEFNVFRPTMLLIIGSI